MAREQSFTCGLAHGLHARPASLLAEALKPFAARVEIVKTVTGGAADLRSVLSVVALDVACGDEFIVRAEGDDAEDALERVREALETAQGEAVALSGIAAPVVARVPAGLRRLGAPWIAGHAISPGAATGPALIVRPFDLAADEEAAGPPDAERARVYKALQEVRRALARRLEATGAPLERDLLRAHLSIADDPALRDRIEAAVDDGQSGIAAVRQAAETFMQTLRASTSVYIRDRVIDVEDVCQQIVEQLSPTGPADALATLDRESVVIADLLTPRQMMELDRNLVRAFVLGRVGATSHTAILARAFGIPALVDVHDVETSFREGRTVIVDADGGFVLPDVSPEVERYYAIEQRAAERRRRRLVPHVEKEARTRDGARLEVGANIASPDEVVRAVATGAEGVGLFRTEMLFLDRPAPPDEAEQYQAYVQAVTSAAGRPVIIRTLDIGGDKPAPYLRLPREENPFLGWRGIRLYERFGDLLRTQLRAIVRASAAGPVRVMAPMVSNAREAAWFRARVRDVQEELRGEGAAFDESMPVGAMVEVPAAALAIDRLAEVADFFSIGTNDLCQYFLAADRGNANVAALCDPLDPSFLRLLGAIVNDARRCGRWIGVCGEMAGDVAHLPLMVGLRPDEISVSPACVLELKAALAGIDYGACRELYQRAVSLGDGAEVRAALRAFMGGAGFRGAAPLIETDLAVIDSDAATKIEAIKELVGLVGAAGRASDLLALEDAVWEREETYSTGLGFGFAIPHCKSEAVRVPTIAVLRLARPLDWGSTDGDPVRVAIMLAIPGVSAEAGRTHMQVLARLARQLMHEAFREAILRARSPDELVCVVEGGIESPPADG